MPSPVVVFVMAAGGRGKACFGRKEEEMGFSSLKSRKKHL